MAVAGRARVPRRPPVLPRVRRSTTSTPSTSRSASATSIRPHIVLTRPAIPSTSCSPSSRRRSVDALRPTATRPPPSFVTTRRWRWRSGPPCSARSACSRGTSSSSSWSCFAGSRVHDWGRRRPARRRSRTRWAVLDDRRPGRGADGGGPVDLVHRGAADERRARARRRDHRAGPAARRVAARGPRGVDDVRGRRGSSACGPRSRRRSPLGVRSQAAWLTLPLLVAVLVARVGAPRRPGRACPALIAYGAGVAVWAIPMVVATGGWRALPVGASATRARRTSPASTCSGPTSAAPALRRARRDLRRCPGRRRRWPSSSCCLRPPGSSDGCAARGPRSRCSSAGGTVRDVPHALPRDGHDAVRAPAGAPGLLPRGPRRWPSAGRPAFRRDAPRWPSDRLEPRRRRSRPSGPTPRNPARSSGPSIDMRGRAPALGARRGARHAPADRHRVAAGARRGPTTRAVVAPPAVAAGSRMDPGGATSCVTSRTGRLVPDRARRDEPGAARPARSPCSSRRYRVGFDERGPAGRRASGRRGPLRDQRAGLDRRGGVGADARNRRRRGARRRGPSHGPIEALVRRRAGRGRGAPRRPPPGHAQRTVRRASMCESTAGRSPSWRRRPIRGSSCACCACPPAISTGPGAFATLTVGRGQPRRGAGRCRSPSSSSTSRAWTTWSTATGPGGRKPSTTP